MSVNIDESNGEGWANLSNALLKVFIISISMSISIVRKIRRSLYIIGIRSKTIRE